jgi:alpha-mannosidase
MDQGRQRFRVRLVPHAGDWRSAGVVRLAAELNQPPFAMLESFHDGPLPPEGSYAADGAANVVMTVLKRAEDGDAYVVRAYESAGHEGRASFDVLGHTWEAAFRANEIKTFRLAGGDVAETDLLES